MKDGWKNNLLNNNKEILSIVDNYDTPLYLYDGNNLRQNYYSFKEKLHKSIDIFYSLKANSNVSIASLFCLWGTGIEVASWAGRSGIHG